MHTRNLSALIAVTLASTGLYAATIYECRSYSGSTFYASNYCSQHNAVGVLNHSVLDGMPFDQQVQLVNAAKGREAARKQDDEARWAQSSPTSNAKEIECKQIDQAIAQKDSQLRQPHSAQWGDHLTAERKKLMDRRFDLRC